MKLSEEREKTFIDVDCIFEKNNILCALEELEAKRDGCGIDGIKISQLRDYWSANGEDIKTAVSEGNYYPGVTSLVEIIKSNRKRRVIAKLNSIDRLILRAIEQILTPYCEAIFDKNTFAYRKNKRIQ